MNPTTCGASRRGAARLAGPLLAALAACSCAGAPGRGAVEEIRGASVGLQRQALRAPARLLGLRLALNHEIQYLNARPDRLALPDELIRLEPGTHALLVDVRVSPAADAPPALLRLVRSVRVSRRGAGRVTIVLSTGGAPGAAPGLALRASGSAALGPPVGGAPPRCDALNPDLTACAAAGDPPAQALCTIRAIRRRARQRLSPGWLGCVNHQDNRLRTARQLHGHAAAGGDEQARDRLFERSRQLLEQTRACVREYFICD